METNSNIRIETERLILRDLEDRDREVLPILMNDLDVTRYLAVVPHPYTRSDADWFIDKTLKNQQMVPRTDYVFGIELREAEDLVGAVGLHHISELDQKATLGYWLGKKYWRNGIMAEAAKKAVDYGFKKLGLQRIEVTASTLNQGSNAVIRKLGFEFEGTAKRYYRAKSTGDFHDANQYSLLKENWKM